MVPPHTSARIALGVSYNGLAYQGWQSQLSGQTVQDHLESALSRIAGHSVRTLCAGRTDAGVHALMQVVHFDTWANRREVSWVRGTNALLPRDIAVQWARQVPPGFHCRASAISRRYVYILLQGPVRPSIDAGRVGWVMAPLALAPMQEASAFLTGQHDFSSFRAAACQPLSPRCCCSSTPAWRMFKLVATVCPMRYCSSTATSHRKTAGRQVAVAPKPISGSQEFPWTTACETLIS